MVIPTVTEAPNRRTRVLRDEIAADEARRISASAFHTIGPRKRERPSDDHFDVVAMLREHHDYPSQDVLDHLDVAGTL